MEVLKLWTKIKSMRRHILIDDTTIDGVTKGIYTADIVYVGSGDDEGYFILLCSFGKYVITNQFGDKMSFSSNIPTLSGSSGTYIIDASKASTATSTVFKNVTENSTYLGINNILTPGWSALKPVHYGSTLVTQNGNHERPVNDRDGNLLAYSRYIFGSGSSGNNTGFDKVNATSNAGTNLLLLQSEFDEGTLQSDLEAIAKLAFDAKDYFYQFEPSGEWSGWSSDNLEGEYEPFGDELELKTIGYLEYLDDQFRVYTKGFEITEDDGVWSFKSGANGEIYNTQTEPSDSDATFTNTEAIPTDITLTFNRYAIKKKRLLVIDNGIDVI